MNTELVWETPGNKNVVEQEFVLNTDLQIVELKSTPLDLYNKEIPVTTTVNGDIQHKNYLSYLSAAWSRHLAPVMKPDHLWQIVLCELSVHIKENAETYRNLFTTSQEKKELSVRTLSATVLPLDQIMALLVNNVPTDMTPFLPSFSTSDVKSLFAFNAAFCDAVSPYYNYSMFMCGFPKIKVYGDVQDWNLFNDSINKLKTLFPTLANYFAKVEKSITDITASLITGNGEIFKTLFNLERCGSGGQVEVVGWIKNFFVKNVSVEYVYNFPTCISDVEYKNLTTNIDYIMKVGLLSSEIIDEYLIPDYGYMVFEKKI